MFKWFWTIFSLGAPAPSKLQKAYLGIGCGHTWDLTLVKGFNRGKKDVKKLYYSKTH